MVRKTLGLTTSNMHAFLTRVSHRWNFLRSSAADAPLGMARRSAASVTAVIKARRRECTCCDDSGGAGRASPSTSARG